MIAAVALIGLLFIMALMATGVALEAAGDHELPALDPAASTTRGVLLELRGRRARR